MHIFPLLLLSLLPAPAPSEEIYGFLDLFKAEKVDIAALISENPNFLGSETGPGAEIALTKVHAAYRSDEYGPELRLLTFADITMTEWDRVNAGRRPSEHVECGDEWKSGRCLDRLLQQGKPPSLVLGAHKDLSSSTAALHAYLHRILYVQTAQIDTNVGTGQQKELKGWANTIRLDPANENADLQAFLEEFSWTSHLTLIHQSYVSEKRAAALFEGMKLLGTSEIVPLGAMYPFSYQAEVDEEEASWIIADNKPKYQDFVNNWFKNEAIRHKSRGKAHKSRV